MELLNKSFTILQHILTMASLFVGFWYIFKQVIKIDTSYSDYEKMKVKKVIALIVVLVILTIIFIWLIAPLLLPLIF